MVSYNHSEVSENMAFRQTSVKWRETEIDQQIQLQQLEIERQKIISRRFYIALWILVCILLLAGGVYGLATENLGLGVPCLIFSVCLGIYGAVFLVIKSIIRNVIRNRRQRTERIDEHTG